MSSEPPPSSSTATPSSTLNSPSHSLHLSYLHLALTEAKKCIPTPTAFCVGAVLVDMSTSSSSSKSSGSGSGSNNNPSKVLSTGYSRELPGNTHAEQCALSKYDEGVVVCTAGIEDGANVEDGEDDSGGGGGEHDDDDNDDDKGLVLYTTMEPCSERLSGNLPCVDRILQWRERRQGQQQQGKQQQQQQQQQEARRIKTVYVGVREPETFIKKNVAWEKLKEAGVRYIHVPGLERECLEVAERGHGEGIN